MVCLGRPYLDHKDGLPQILLGRFLNTLTHNENFVTTSERFLKADIELFP